MLKRLKIINLIVIASLMLVFTFSSFDKARAQALNLEACDGVPFPIGWLSVPVTPLTPTPPDFVAGLLGTIEGFGGNTVGGLDWLYNDAAFINTTSNGSQLVSWWSQKNGRNTLLQVTNTNDGLTGVFDVAVHVQILREDCLEIRDFCDTYTFNDTHVYDFSNIVSNAGQDISDANIQGREGLVVVTPVSSCSATTFPAIAHNFFQGNLTITNPSGDDYGTNVYARFADDTTTAFTCTTLTGDSGCSLEVIVPSILQKDFNIVGTNAAAADLVFLQFADDYGLSNSAYQAVAAISRFGPFSLTNDAERFESCTPITACFARLGIDDALPISEDFRPPTPSPTVTVSPPVTCDDNADCPAGQICVGAVEGACDVSLDPCFEDADCPEGEVCDGGRLGVCQAPTPSPTVSPGDGGDGGGCAVAGPVSLGTAMANILLPLVPVGFAFGLRALRRRNRKEEK